MSFGRRTAQPAPTLVGPSTLAAARPAVVARKGGYWLGLLAAALSLPVVAIAAESTVMPSDTTTSLELLIVSLQAIPGLLMFAVPLFALADWGLRRARITHPAVYAVACGVLTWLPFALISVKIFIVPILVPAMIGGVVLSFFRRSA